MQPPRAQYSETLSPNGMQSGLSLRSNVTIPLSGSTSTATFTSTPPGRPGIGSCRERALEVPRRQPAYRLLHRPLGVVEPLADERLDRLQPVPLDHLLNPPFADPGRAHRGEVVAVPHLGNPDPAFAHPDDVVDVPVVLLDLHTREDEPALRVDVVHIGDVGRRFGVSAVRLVRLGRGGEDVLALDEDGDQDRVVGGVGVAEDRVVVEKGIALAEIGVKLAHRAGLQPGAEDMHLQTLRGSEELVVRGDDRAGEVARHVEDRGAAGAEEGVGHLPDDRFEAVCKDGKQGRVHEALFLHGSGLRGSQILGHPSSNV